MQRNSDGDKKRKHKQEIEDTHMEGKILYIHQNRTSFILNGHKVF